MRQRCLSFTLTSCVAFLLQTRGCDAFSMPFLDATSSLAARVAAATAASRQQSSSSSALAAIPPPIYDNGLVNFDIPPPPDGIFGDLDPAHLPMLDTNQYVAVPNGFFTWWFFIMSIAIQWTKAMRRTRLEERAFELRLEAARDWKLEQDPTLTERELIIADAAKWPSAYGKEARERRRRQQEVPGAVASTSSRASVGVATAVDIEREDDSSHNSYRASVEEQELLERDYGIPYDPYYDDPYTEEELPDDTKFKTDKRYGDRIYDNGEVFYKEAETGLFYRQGARPRSRLPGWFGA